MSSAIRASMVCVPSDGQRWAEKAAWSEGRACCAAHGDAGARGAQPAIVARRYVSFQHLGITIAGSGSASWTGAQPPALAVAVVDVRRLLAEAFAALIASLDGFVVAAVVDSACGLPLLVTQTSDLVLAHVGAEPAPVLELIQSLRGSRPELPIVILSDAMTSGLIRFVLDEELNGLILTDAPLVDLRASLGQVAAGHAILPVGWHRILSDASHAPLASLSSRQLEVLTLITEGCSYEEVASRLFISLNTVKTHMRCIYRRLRVSNRVAAACMLTSAMGAGGAPRINGPAWSGQTHSLSRRDPSGSVDDDHPFG